MEKSIPLTEVSKVIGMTPQGFGKIARKDEDSVLKGNKRLLSPQFIREVFESRGYVYPKDNLMFHCIKGGAGKSELSRTFSFRASQYGAKVLIVDCDKQANTSRALGIDNPKFVLVDVITGKCKLEEAIIQIDENLSLLPSSIKNARLELELINKEKNPQNFYDRLFSSVRDRFDLTVWDMSPDLNHNSYLVSLYSTHVVVPTTPSRFSMDGMSMTLESLDGLKEQFPDKKREISVILNMYDARERASFSLLSELNDIKNVNVLPVVIRADTAFKNAHAENRTVFQTSKKSNAREDVDIFTQELLGLKEYFGPKGEA
jgi:chromosome partitioning protein